MTRFYEQNGHFDVPQRTKTGERSSLHAWVSEQRTKYQVSGNISEDRIAKLNEIGFDWRIKDQVLIGGDGKEIVKRKSLAERNEDNLKQLAAFKEEHGHCNVSTKAGSLGNWIRLMRKKQAAGELDADLLAKLNDLGMNWSGAKVDRESQWDAKYEELKAFYEEHGHTRMTMSRSQYDPLAR